MKAYFILPCLLFFLCTTIGKTQDISRTIIKAVQDAQTKMDSIEIRLGTTHPSYAKAQIELAVAYFMHEDTDYDGRDAAEEALQLLIDSLGPLSPIYINAVAQLPKQEGRLLDRMARFNFNKQKYGKTAYQTIKAKILIGKAHFYFEDSDGHDACFDALKACYKHHPKRLKQFTDFTCKGTPLPFQNTIKAQMELYALGETPEKLGTRTHAMLLLKLANLEIKYSPISYLVVYDSEGYLNFWKALRILRDIKAPKKDINYAMRILTDKMRAFFPFENKFYTLLAEHKMANDQTLAFLNNEFIEKVMQVKFLEYDAEDMLDMVLEDIEATEGDKKNRFYATISAIRNNLYKDEEDIQRSIKKDILANIKASQGTYNKDYVIAHIEYINASNGYISDEKVLKKYYDAISDAASLDDFISNEFYSEALSRIDSAWQLPVHYHYKFEAEEFLLEEDSSAVLKLKLANYFLETDILEEKAIEYAKEGLTDISAPKLPQIYPLLKRFIAYDSAYYAEQLENLLGKRIAPKKLEYVLNSRLDTFFTTTANISPEQTSLFALIADAHLFHPVDSNSYSLANETYIKALSEIAAKEGYEYAYKSILLRICGFLMDKKLQKKLTWTFDEQQNYFNKYLRYTNKLTNSIGAIRQLQFSPKFGDWLYEQDKLIAAEAHYQRTLALVRKVKNPYKYSIDYEKIYYRLARIYRKTGRYPQSKKYYYEALELAELDLSPESAVRCYDGLGLLSQTQKHFEESFIFYKKAFDLLKEELEDGDDFSFSDPKLIALLQIKVLRHMGTAHLFLGELDQAAKYFQAVIDFEEKSKYVDYDYDISLQLVQAKLAQADYQDIKAEKLYKKAVFKLKDIAERAEAMQDFATFFEAVGKVDSAFTYYQLALNLDLNNLKVSYKKLSEAERLLYLSTINQRFNRFFAFVARHPEPSYIQTALDANLIIKGLALETTTSIRNMVRSSENTELRKAYKFMLQQRKKVANLSTDTSSNAPFEMQMALDSIRIIENEIAKKAKALATFVQVEVKACDFNLIQQQLKTDEVAISFLRLPQEVNGEIDAIYYAILIKNELENTVPSLIPLGLESDLSLLLQNEVRLESINYITDPITSIEVSDLVWLPLRDSLKNIKTVHLHTTGLLTKIAFGTLLTNDLGERIMDKWDIRYYNTFRDLTNPKTTSQYNRQIKLIGGVNYNKKNSPSSDSLASDSITQTTPLKEVFNYLPGTLSEINGIQAQVKNTEWTAHQLSQQEAQEIYIHQINEYNAPQILHIATHGFFFGHEPNPKKITTYEQRLTRQSNPMLRSGLALAGINMVWQQNQQINAENDGVLTAYEVANLDLYNTELVVLSACETGRGDISDAEGTIGLQHAFKVAGADRLLISLWKVPDAQTAELMEYFYKDLTAGKPANEAFRNAQFILRRKYPNPYYWAAFILIE